MSEEDKALVRRIVDEAWSQGKLEVIDEAFAPDYQEHNPRPGQELGIDGYKRGILMTRAAFPDLFLDVHDIIAEDDRIALLYTLARHPRRRSDGNTVVGPAGIERWHGVRPIRRWKCRREVERAGHVDPAPADRRIRGGRCHRMKRSSPSSSRARPGRAGAQPSPGKGRIRRAKSFGDRQSTRTIGR